MVALHGARRHSLRRHCAVALPNRQIAKSAENAEFFGLDVALRCDDCRAAVQPRRRVTFLTWHMGDRVQTGYMGDELDRAHG
jgi:hypothetical protein